MMTSPLTKTAKIEIAHIAKSFDEKPVLKDISLKIEEGQSCCIIGTSGCGKSVTLKCLLGLITPDSGSILIDGVDTVGQSRTAREEMLRQFGMTFQFGALFDSLPIWENVTFRLRQTTAMPRASARKLAADIVVQLGLEARVIDQYPAELSGGMQKRVALARAIADKPQILLFDEPTSGLDPITGGVIDSLIVASVRNLGATALTISHDMASVRRIADKVAMLHNGKVIWQGPVSDMDNTGIPEVHQFVHGYATGPLTDEAIHAARKGDQA